jgi:hypothetical protein
MLSRMQESSSASSASLTTSIAFALLQSERAIVAAHRSAITETIQLCLPQRPACCSCFNRRGSFPPPGVPGQEDNGARPYIVLDREILYGYRMWQSDFSACFNCFLRRRLGVYQKRNPADSATAGLASEQGSIHVRTSNAPTPVGRW